MNIYESHAGMYVYQHLPAFAKYLLEHHLDEYVQDQLALAREINIPLLKYLKDYSTEQLAAFLTQSSREYLVYLAENRAKEQLIASFSRWLANDLKIIGKAEISSKDVTVLNYMRMKLFKKWIRAYDIPLEQKFELIDEVDNLFFGAITSGTETLIGILKETIATESHFNAELINTSPGIIFIFDLQNMQEIYVNGNVRDIMGYTPEEIVAMGPNILPALTHPEDAAYLNNVIAEVLNQTKGTNPIEYRFKHKDGKFRWLRTYHTIFKRDADGKPLELLGTTFDVTREKETAQVLINREAQLLEAQAIAQLGSFEWDIENDVSTNTPELVNILELTSPSNGISGFLARVHPEDKAAVAEAIANAQVTGQYDCQYRYLGNNGEKVLWAHGIITSANGHPPKMKGTIQDITQLKKIEAELKAKTRELERSNESLQQFASVASHDLKEPLRKMSMYSDLVLLNEEHNLTDQSKSSLYKVKSSAIRMQQMINDILNFSTISSDAQKKPVKLTEILKESLLILEESIQEKKAEIAFTDLPCIRVAGSQIRQLFQNLLANALKFAKKNSVPKITITHRYATKHEFISTDLKPAKRYLVVRIEDNGIGFKPEYADKIFGLFTRLHPQATYEGTGLGLSICKRIAENHGGIILAEGKPDQGAAFSIVLPDED